MKKEQFEHALGEICDEYLAEAAKTAEKSRVHRRIPLKKILPAVAALLACAVFVIHA